MGPPRGLGQGQDLAGLQLGHHRGPLHFGSGGNPLREPFHTGRQGFLRRPLHCRVEIEGFLSDRLQQD
mgnify:CR=1 FL=1